MNSDKLLARLVALANDEEQAAFLNEMGRSLRLLCHIDDGSEFMQLARISDHLDDNGKRLIRKLSECFE